MSSPALTYALTTSPNPLTAGLNDGVLTILATNNSGGVVTLQGMEITICTGTASNDLTNEPTQVTPILPTGWTISKPQTSSGAYTFVFTPPENKVQIANGGSLVFVLTNIVLNAQAGISQLTITEGSTSLEPYPTHIEKVSVYPASWSSITFIATPPQLPEPGDITLVWDGPQGATYQISYLDPATDAVINIPAQGDPPLSNNGTYPGSTNPPLYIGQTTVFTLTVTEEIAGTLFKTQSQQTVSVVPAPPQILTFTSVPGTIEYGSAPQTITLTWTTANASLVQITGIGNFTGAQAAQGSVVIPAPLVSTSYFMTASGETTPPATATYWLLCEGSTSNSFGNIGYWQNANPTEEWQVVINNGLEAFSVQTDGGGPGQTITIFLVLPSNLQIASLNSPNVDYESLLSLPYSSSFNPFTIYTFNAYSSGGVPTGVGTAWAIKFPDGTIAVVWYASGTTFWPYEDPWEDGLNVTFNWITYKAAG
ncbi:MAG: hypothetical protein KBB37_00405 [Bacteroidia bacterium]|nr:hypothetical protein [Bacteroidia bacterium]MBP7259718.1 hypothetical protein [Bacteroidia bacterium]MBP9180108.1 hypothetical protein [Bacteroidia bacterium]MBP9723331.1 hypothetical protein [Bacteroidia bacterium]